ncbi:MAG: urease accessory UreF family protein [Microlunatus sp.]
MTTTESDNSAYLSLLLADGRLPTGAHTQSAGLEPALNHGLELADVPAYVRARLTTVTEVEAAATVVARHVFVSDLSDSMVAMTTTESDNSAYVGRRLAEVDRAWRVRTMSAALRDASDLLGRSYLRLASSVWPRLCALTTAPQASGRARSSWASDRAGPSPEPGGTPPARAIWCRAVVLGATAAEAGLDAAQTARLVGYDDVQTVIAAALKLRPFDPAVGVSWSIAAGAEVEALVARVAGLTEPDQIPAYAAPQIEHWAELHTRTERRLFRA